MRRGAGKLQVIFACIFSRPTARNLTRLNACGSWFGAAVFTNATLQPWMTSSLLLNLYSKFGPAQTVRCDVSVVFFNIMQLFMSLCLVINGDARTRVDLLDGSFVGPRFWSEALVGLTTNSLSHLGVPTEHRTGGTIQPEGIYVPYDGNPGVSQWGWVYVQLAAWDGRV